MSTSRAHAHRSVVQLWLAMKLVVTGWVACRRMVSRSRMKHSRSWSSVNRAKSSRCAGLTTDADAAGAEISSQAWYHWPQKAVPQAAFSAAREP